MPTLTQKIVKAAVAATAGAVVSQMLLRRARWFDWRDRVVIITGASRGLGLVMARQVGSMGAKVAICARSEADLRTAQAQLERRAIPTFAQVCDVTDPASVDEFVEAVRNRFGQVDVLVNSAGVIEVGPWETMTREDYELAMGVHMWGPLHMTRAVVPLMKARGWGRILNVASIGGKFAAPHLVPYSASKFALVGLSKALRAELARDGILVTVVCPSLMRTGSPRNVIVKGQHRKEYAWFSISDSLPGLSMNAEQAAAKILKICQGGQAESLVAGLMTPVLKVSQFFPNCVAEASTVANFFLPDRGGIGQQSARGYESESALSPSLLTQLSNKVEPQNNER